MTITCREAISGLTRSFVPAAAGSLVADIYYKVTGRETGNYTLHIADGKCTFREGAPPSASLIIETPAEVWVAIGEGRLSLSQAYKEGKLRAVGDLSLLNNLGSLFKTL
jgi:putative sterol carrier protein